MRVRQIESYSFNILDRTKKFAVEIIKLSSELPRNPAGFSISDQLVRSSCSIGANLIEAQEAVSSQDFYHKINISLKEAKEAKYWLELTVQSALLENTQVGHLLQEIDEIIKILVAILRKLKLKLKR